MSWGLWRLGFCFASLLLPIPAASEGLFDRFTVEDGLSHNQINDLAQDSLGFLWIATPDGLTRFDGYTFVQYRHDYSDSASLPANFVGTVYVDRSGNLWAGTFNGICRYDPTTNDFVRYPIQTESRHGSNGYSVLAIRQGSDSTLWISSDKGIYRLFPGQQALIPLTTADRKPNKLLASCFAQDPWIDMMWMGLQTRGIAVADERNGSLFRFRSSSPEEQLLANSRITSIIPDTSIRGERVLWVSTAINGLFKLNLFGELNDSIHVTHPGRASNSIAHLPVLSLFRDKRGSFWSATGDDGLLELSLREGNIRQVAAHRYDARVTRSISNNTITTLLEDHSGNIWVGTLAGLNKMVRRRREFQHYTPASVPTVGEQSTPSSVGARCMFEDSRGVIWVGTQTGRVYAFDPKKSGADAFQESNVNRALSSGFAVTAIHEMKAHPGTLWIGTYGNGLFRWETRSGAISQQKNSATTATSLSSNFINCMADDEQGRLWIGTDSGLNVLDPIGLKATRFVYTPTAESHADTTRLMSNAIWAIVPDRNPRSPGLWIGTIGGWLSRLDLRTSTFRHVTSSTTPALTNRSVASLHCDSSGTLWIGTYSGGLKRLDPSRQLMSEYTIREGLPNNMIQGILQDSKGRLWLSTNNGLCCLNPESKEVQSFEMHDGLQSNQFHRNAFLKDRTGAMLFGGPNGLNWFHPDSITLNAYPPRVLLTRVQVLGNSRNIVSALAGRASVELTHTDNFLSFEFLAIDLTNPKRNRYAYMLEGADNSWIESGSGRSTTYANLSPGRYTFHVKASNNDGIWSEGGGVLSISILPPFWRTWWFLSGALVLCMSAIVAVYRSRVNNQIQRRLEIERVRGEESEKVRIKTARDFHDEMGHRLTRINMLSETASRKLEQSPAEVKELLDAIRDNANHLFNGTRDFIWSLDSRSDSLFDFAVRLKDFGDELFYKADVAFQATGITQEFHSIRLQIEVRRQLMLIVKEALTNCARHARAGRVELEFRIEDQTLVVSLTDDGTGFEAGYGDSGTGMSNMHTRAKKIGGVLTIDSASDRGTRVSFRGPLTPV